MNGWIFYDMPWWAPYLWGFACYALMRFLVHYIWRRLR